MLNKNVSKLLKKSQNIYFENKTMCRKCYYKYFVNIYLQLHVFVFKTEQENRLIINLYFKSEYPIL